MQTVMVYSESGGATKTTTAVSLAMAAAEKGLRVVLVDLDPRAAATEWFDVTPAKKGKHVGWILDHPEPRGWAEDMAVPSGWHENLRVLPSDRNVSNREAEQVDHGAVRLKLALEGLAADVVVIDSPNRQGGPLIQNALTAADTVVYAATPTKDGRAGVRGARQSVERFVQYRKDLGAPVDLTEAGVIVGSVPTTIMTRIQVHTIEKLRETGMLLTPLVPARTVVQEARETSEWYGDYTKGEPVADAYRALIERILK